MKADTLFFYPKELIDKETQSLALSIRQWADKEVIANRLKFLENYRQLVENSRKKLAMDIGLQQMIWPEDYGGGGFNSYKRSISIVRIIEEISRADPGIGFMYAANLSSYAPMVMEPHIDKDLCAQFAPMFCGKELKTGGSLILPGAGDIDNKDETLFLGRTIQVAATLEDDEWVINGKGLRPLNSGASAELFCIVCASAYGGKGGKKAKGIPSIIYVPGDSKGIKRGKAFKKTGLHADKNADVSFNNVRVPKAYMVKRDGAVKGVYLWLNLCMSATCIGSLMNVYEIIKDWVDVRVIKGKGLIKENPLDAAVLAEIAEDITLSRMLTYNLANIMTKPEVYGSLEQDRVFALAEMIGMRVASSALHAINRTMELMGSAGYATEWNLEKHWRDVKTIQSYLCGIGANVPVSMDIARLFFDCKEI